MRTAVVVGAGVAGMATAGALARTGWKVTLLEREDRLRPGRAALILWPNGVRALRALGLAGGLDSVATPVGALGVRRPDGQWLVTPEQTRIADDDPPVILHREDLHDALVAGLGDQVDIRTGVRVRAARPDGERPAVTDGRTTFEADLIVAADGTDSVVRHRLAPQSRHTTAGYAAWRALIPWYRVPPLAAGVPASGETIGVGHGFVHVAVGEPGVPSGTSQEGVYWTATAPGAPRPEPPETQLALLRRWFADWPSPTQELLAATTPEDLVQQGVGELWPPPRALAFVAGTGGYALVGDAGHAMASSLGQGACLALEDAVTLQLSLRDATAGPTLGRALDAYSRARRPRVVRIANRSRQLGAALQGRGGFGAALRGRGGFGAALRGRGGFGAALRGRGGLGARARSLAAGRSLPRLLERAAAEARDWRPPAG